MSHSRISIKGATRLYSTHCVALCDDNHPLMVLGVQCSTLNTQTMMRGFASHLGKLAQKAVFVAALARFATASARGRVKRCRHELTHRLGFK